MNAEQKFTEPVDKRTLQQRHFDDLYVIFKSFYAAALKKADKPHDKVRLQLTTMFFDDVELQRMINPVFAQYTTNVAEKQAVARAALQDASHAHYFGSFLQPESKQEVKIVNAPK